MYADTTVRNCHFDTPPPTFPRVRKCAERQKPANANDRPRAYIPAPWREGMAPYFTLSSSSLTEALAASSSCSASASEAAFTE